MREHFEIGPKRLLISFSGGRTSGYMLQLILNSSEYEDWEKVITFANTGCEHEATLDFVHQCDQHICRPMGHRVVWLEAKVNPERGKGVRHTEVSYGTASRNGEPFEAYIAKYGIPNKTNPSCTARLKENVMTSYLRSLGWGKRGYWSAIGIRADEMDRISRRRIDNRLVYPLAEAGVDVNTVKAWWARQPFDLQIKGDHWGNCVWCWKKSLRKLMTLAREDPTVFDFPRKMEEKYGRATPLAKSVSPDGVRRFFREHRSAEDILAMAETQEFTPYSDRPLEVPMFDHLMDIGGGCSESCEIGTDEGDREKEVVGASNE